MPKLLTQGVSLEPRTGRQLIGIVAGFKSERWPVINRNAGRLQTGIRTLAIEGEKIFWKIDYYAPDMMHGSDDPSDPKQTRRVLTIMLAEEY